MRLHSLSVADSHFFFIQSDSACIREMSSLCSDERSVCCCLNMHVCYSLNCVELQKLLYSNYWPSYCGAGVFCAFFLSSAKSIRRRHVVA